MVEKDAILSKISIVQNCLKMIQRATSLDPKNLDDAMLQDVFVLNIQRAVQACIDMAHLMISEKGLKLPTTYKEAFLILAKEKFISDKSASKMGKMCGFRNIAIHDYQSLDIAILKSILINNLKDFEEFYAQVYKVL